MRRIGLAFLLLVAGVLVGVSLRPNLAADPPKEKEEEKKEKPIPIDEVRKRGILGDLGHPLGTIVRVEGEVIAWEGKYGKASESETLLHMETVNGTKLEQGVIFFYRGAEADKPKVGDKLKYIGYETGRFEGLVKGNELHRGDLVAGVAFGFVRRFDILKDELKSEKK